MRPVFIVAGGRTPFTAWRRGKRGDGKPGGALSSTDIFDLGAAALTGAVLRAGVEPGALDRVVFGSAYHPGPHACYLARYVSLRAGIPASVSAASVHLVCASGLYALMTGAQDIAGGMSLVGVGGTDNISCLRKDVFVPSFFDVSMNRHIGDTIEDLAAGHGVSREDADDFALRSHRLAGNARRLGRLADEIVPVGDVVEDDLIPDSPPEDRVRGAKPLHRPDGVVTAGNTHGLADGASALILASEEGLKKCTGEPLGRLVSSALVGIEPKDMGYASVPAVRQVLERAGSSIDDIDLVEINETFATQMCIDIRELGIPEEKVNVNGGAVSLGHAFGGTGCKLLLGLLLELRRRGLRRGLCALSMAGGQGLAVVVERP